jgi:hypothetical protein
LAYFKKELFFAELRTIQKLVTVNGLQFYSEIKRKIWLNHMKHNHINFSDANTSFDNYVHFKNYSQLLIILLWNNKKTFIIISSITKWTHNKLVRHLQRCERWHYMSKYTFCCVKDYLILKCYIIYILFNRTFPSI